jgi:S1-C subfamily serine protease
LHGGPRFGTLEEFVLISVEGGPAMWRWLCVLVLVPCLLAAAPPARKAPPKKRGYFGLQLRAADKPGTGIQVVVVLDGPAKDAGMKPGDVILSVDGLKPADLRTAVQLIGGLKPGRKVKVRIRRDGKEKELTVKVGTLG